MASYFLRQKKMALPKAGTAIEFDRTLSFRPLGFAARHDRFGANN
jgi:hypothetical protein